MAMRPHALLTREDLEQMPDDGCRYELLDGELHVSPAARRRHQWVVMRIAHRLMGWVESDGHGRVYPGVNVDLAADTHLEPDVAWSASEDDSGLGFDRTPDLVVEVASPATRTFDRGTKRDRYVATGAREVWLVDLDRWTIEQTIVRDGLVDATVVHGAGDAFSSPLLEGVRFDVDDLLDLGDDV